MISKINLMRISIKPFSAVINLGLEYGYEQISISENEVIKFIPLLALVYKAASASL